ncbi:Chemotaxis response regulator protein-glutamate methylesterase of group 1 operon [Lentibacillus sp. JNUCC-1]|uniref:LytR/AlgR family response regulator transcription factor n=1 Tax=Lentibacillus sp. JNUCC-1 TaxID=2654513 RepID=UPI0012E7F96F|nr:LytTR family DNA-binding domain-containing protein [Lentibacillus sp. JNUCC-1]MUV38213.1 Chemotaxis response regulator protein-glutamate methylesterase of group 1 operon [Lentibacillus sp. JNUCC-1]
MLEIRTLIVDDDQNAINTLIMHLTSFPFIHVEGDVNDGKSAMRFLRTEQIDLIFLDIEMDDIDGLQLAGHIQSLNPAIMIIFVTGHAGFALEGYEHHPLDFLTKPVDFFRLEKSMQLVEKQKTKHENPSEPNQKIGMKVAGGIRIVNVKDIVFIEKKGRKIHINCKKEDSFQSSDSMKNLENIFAPYGFYRCHQSFIVPIHQIKAIMPDAYTRSHAIQLKDNTELPLSRNKYHELTSLLSERGITIY